MKYKKVIAGVIAVMGVILLFESRDMIRSRGEQPSTQKSFNTPKEAKMRDGYPVNENGETYGTVKRDSLIEPDLQLTDAGGYIKKSDMDDGVRTIEDAVLQSEKSKEGRVIPLYEKDGKTVIGEYYIGGGN